MSKSQSKGPKWLYGLTLGLWLVTLPMFVISFHNNQFNSAVVNVVSILLGILPILTLITLIIYIMSNKKEVEASRVEATNNFVTKLVALSIPVALIICTFAAIKSLWLGVGYTKYVYENISTAALIGSLILLAVLNTLQKDVYWFNRNKKILFDERQLRERQAVLEKSYKITGLTAIFVALIGADYLRHLPTFARLNNPSSTYLPTHAIFPLYSFAAAIVSMPLIVAALTNKSSK